MQTVTYSINSEVLPMNTGTQVELSTTFVNVLLCVLLLLMFAIRSEWGKAGGQKK